MKSNRIAWLGLASVAAGAIVAAACSGANEVPPVGNGVCGNGVAEGAEQCDDGNTQDGDDCTAACRDNVCGDGIVNTGVEKCDDGGDAVDCDSECPDDPPDPTECGNGQLDEGEDCDEWDEGEQKKNTPTCNTNCSTPGCDDGILNLAAGECCEISGEFNCDDYPELVEKKNNGEDDWCLCGDPGTGGGGPTPEDCDEAIVVAGIIVNPAMPSSTTPSGNGVSSVWSYGGQLGIQAGNDMCAQQGGDHVCEWDEVVAANEKGQIDDLMTTLGYTSMGFWIHRVNATVDVPGMGMSEPGPGGRCNDWTYPTGHIANSEMGLWKVSPTGLAAQWQTISDTSGPTNLHALFDGDTCYTGNSSTCPGSLGGGALCGSHNPSTASNGNTTVTGILCCFPVCEE